MAHLPRHCLHPLRLPGPVQETDRGRIARERAVGEGVDVVEVERRHGREDIPLYSATLQRKVLHLPYELVPGRNYLPGVFGYACRGRDNPSPET